MISYVYMKLLERRPARYDQRLTRASRGHLLAMRARVVELLADHLAPGAAILEIGCGTGALALALVERGFDVTGIDASPAMLAEAKRRQRSHPRGDGLSLRAQGVGSMDGLPDAALDGVIATLVFSELSDDERHFALTHAHRALRPGGLLLIADEAVPRTRAGRLRHRLGRAPALALTYLVTGQGSRPLADPAGELRAAGFALLLEERSQRDAFALLLGRRAPEGPSLGASP